MIVAVTADERRRVGAVVEEVARASSLVELLSATLPALDEHLGFAKSAFMLALAEPPLPGRRAYAGVTHGSPPYVLEEYFERWADCDALASEAARGSFRRTGRATIHDAYRFLDPPGRRFVDDFLRRTHTTAQLSHRLPIGWTDAYLTLMSSEEHTARDVELVGLLLPELTELLRPHLPRGLDGDLSVREAQTAELVALGFSNREISEVLHVEEDTVKKHVSRAMAKVGVARRTALAVAWATGHRMDVQGVLS
jgi:DNA-binding CsgD family transcriptional regulator